MSTQVVTKGMFKKLLKGRLGDLYDEAETILEDFGPFLSFDVANVLTHAADQGQDKVTEVLAILGRHFEEHLKFQHPDIRGTVRDDFGINETEAMFLDVCRRVLTLQVPK